MEVKRTERGWAGHHICSARCLFHRNTLLEHGDIAIVISTVGNMMDIHAAGFPNVVTLDTVGLDRHFETMAFHMDPKNKYKDADVSRHVNFDSDWAIKQGWKELQANEMHETVVNEITAGLLAGKTY